MDRIKQIMLEGHGADLSCFHLDFLRKTMEKRMGERGCTSYTDYEVILRIDESEGYTLMQALHVDYSDFYREPFAFFSLSQTILPDIISRKNENQEIRIWSVGCSQGQEPYSIAMEASRLIEQSGKSVRLRIFASDLSEADLKKARLGRYQRDQVASLSLRLLDRYFTKTGSVYEISDDMKERVRFTRYDVLDPETICPIESIFGGFDIIFCRNLMIYYRPECQYRILDKLKKNLAAGGYLITGEAEKGIVKKWSAAKALSYPGAVFSLS